MKIEYVNGSYLATIYHENGHSEIRGYNMQDVISAAIKNRFDYVNGI